MNRKRRCHYCGQELPEHRLGVRLTPQEGRIFDYIVAAGSSGLSNGDLSELTGLARQTLKVHIYNINNKLSDTGYQISTSAVRTVVRRLVKTDKRARLGGPLIAGRG